MEKSLVSSPFLSLFSFPFTWSFTCWMTVATYPRALARMVATLSEDRLTKISTRGLITSPSKKIYLDYYYHVRIIIIRKYPCQQSLSSLGIEGLIVKQLLQTSVFDLPRREY